MKCLRCGAAIDLGKTHCPGCGTPLDADGDGVPDVLDQLVERKARALLDAEKQRAAEEAALAEQRAAAQAARDRRATDERRLESARRELEDNRGKRRPIWYASTGWLVVLLVIAGVVGGVLLPACFEPITERSLFAARLFCPSVCPSCRGPGRIFTWHESSSSYEGNVSTQLCTNDVVDVERLQWMEVSNREDSDLRPYRLTLWTSVLLDLPFVFALLFLVSPFQLARWRRRSLERERERLEGEIEELERRLGPSRPPPERGGYR